MDPPSFPQGHPEQHLDEYFLGNANEHMLEALPRFSTWSTLRRGQIAYSREGKPLEQPGWFPIFIKQREWEEVESQPPNIT